MAVLSYAISKTFSNKALKLMVILLENMIEISDLNLLIKGTQIARNY